jgi:hypothetical protein
LLIDFKEYVRASNETERSAICSVKAAVCLKDDLENRRAIIAAPALARAATALKIAAIVSGFKKERLPKSAPSCVGTASGDCRFRRVEMGKQM